MVRRQIDRRHHAFGRSLDNGKRIAPTQQSVAGVAARLSPFTDEHVKKLAKNLNRNHGCLLRQSANEVHGGVTPLRAIDAFGIGQHIRVERDPHRSSS
jgi:hypothetical protein